jgi:hypothetical protein
VLILLASVKLILQLDIADERGSGGCQPCVAPLPNVLGQEKKRALLDMARACVNIQTGHPQEMLRDDLGDFQGIEFRQFQFRQDSLRGPGHSVSPLAAEDSYLDISSNAEKGPSHTADFSAQFIAVEVPNQSPAAYIGLSFKL